MSDDSIELDDNEAEKPQKGPQLTKATQLKIKEAILSMVANNYSKSGINKQLQKDFGITSNNAYKYYMRALEDLKDDYYEEIKDIRAKRIKGLERDLLEAYEMFWKQDLYSSLKQKWFETYISIKKQIDSYYPNLIEKEDEGDVKITISYNNTSDKKDNE